MANICLTDIAIYGNDTKRLTDLYYYLSRYVGKWEDQLTGYPIEGVCCEGKIHAIEYSFDGVIYLFLEDHWCPQTQWLDYVLKRYPGYPGIQYVYMAEEPNGDLFINTDTEHRYFKVKARVHIGFEGDTLDGYVENDAELLPTVCKLLEKEFDTLEEAEAYISEHDGWLEINEFTTAE